MECFEDLLLFSLPFIFVTESFRPVILYFVCLWVIDVSRNQRCKCDRLYFCSFNCNKRPSSLHWNVCWDLCFGCCRVPDVSSPDTTRPLLYRTDPKVFPDKWSVNQAGSICSSKYLRTSTLPGLQIGECVAVGVCCFSKVTGLTRG